MPVLTKQRLREVKDSLRWADSYGTGGGGGGLPRAGGLHRQEWTHFPHPTSASPTTTTTTPLKSVGLIPAPAFVTDRVVLSKHKVRAGTAIAGTLVVTNRSSNPINLTKQCEPDYVIVIRNRAINQEPAFTTSCVSQPLILHPGVNRFPISVTTTYLHVFNQVESQRVRCRNA